jgi:glycerol transport system permease protein
MPDRHTSFAPIIFAFCLATPLYWLLVMSFKTNAEIMGGITLYPHAPNFDSYKLIFTDPDWYWGYINAIIYVLLNVMISITVAVPAAYGFSRYDFPAKRALFFAFLMFRMMAPAILLVPFVQIFSDLNLIDTHIAVALAHCFFNVPLAIWILEGFISAVPREMDESARIDGHSTFSLFTRILLPQIAPGIAVTAFFCFMFSWVEYLMSNGLTTVNAKPISGIMTRGASIMSANIELLSAASIIGLIPGIIVIYVMRKHLARGFSMGRVT